MRLIIVVLLVMFMCTFAISDVAAQANLGLKGAGFRVGVVGPEDLDATVGVGVFANMGTITPNIALQTYIDYWSKSEAVFGGETSVRDIAFGAKGMYFFPVANPRVNPFAGAGLGLHFVHAEVTTPDQYINGFYFPGMTVEDSFTRLGIDIGGGVTSPITPSADFIGELWYGIVSDVSQLWARVGVSFRFNS